MIYSMTGFGRSRLEIDGRVITVEVRSVNHRYLDVNPRVPRSISFAEETVRKLVAKHINRGRTDIFISYDNRVEGHIEVVLNKEVASAWISGADELKSEFDMDGRLKLSDVIKLPDVMEVREAQEDEDKVLDIVSKAVTKAMEKLCGMRLREGERLVEDIKSRLDMIGEAVLKIDARTPYVTEEYKDKLKARLEELLKGTELDPQRFDNEVAYFADRSSITEEVVRLKSHLTELRSMLNKGGVAGRKLDFLVQELNREINTIGSKSSDVRIAGTVIFVKSEIEKIREQVQNIE